MIVGLFPKAMPLAHNGLYGVTRELFINEKAMVPVVDLSINCVLDNFIIVKNISYYSKSLFYSWLTTAHTVP